MDETKLYSWFLGPKAENADLLERLVLEALRDCVFWRRNFHPEDDIIITEKVKREDVFQDSLALVRQEFLTLLANPAEEFGEVGSMKALRSTVMSPWLALSRGGNPDYISAFAAVLKQVICSSVAGSPPSIGD